jgi:SAM-dependent methyltransferase
VRFRTDAGDTVGLVEHVSIEAGTVRLSGWIHSYGAAVRGFELRWGSRVREADVSLGLEHRDLPRFYPALPGADRAAFRVVVPVSAAERAALRGELIELTPLLESGRGRRLFALAEPRLAPPSPDELGLVSHNLPIAFEFLAHFVDLAGLGRDDDVVDIGCGVGRMAFALAHHLSPAAHYEGFDVVPRFHEVAEKRFADLPNFRFVQVDAANGYYNPDGGLTAAELSFPYPDGSFDFAFLSSVFTHLRPPEVRHYLDEIRRVLRPGGRCLASFFLLDEEARDAVACKRATPALAHALEECFAEDPARPETAIGYGDDVALPWIEDRFRIDGVYPGSWCGRARFTSYQDLVAFRRAS